MSRRPSYVAETLQVQLRPIGTMRSPRRVHHEVPRQAGGDGGEPGEIHIAQGLQNSLKDLAGFSHIWVLFWCHHVRGCNQQVVPPRDRSKRGLLATRSPNRPNPIGLSCLRLLRIDKRVLHVGDHDLLDGTPILDIKPYLPYCDSVPDAAIGYVADLAADAPDHRTWWTDKATRPPAVYRERGYER